MSVTSVIRRKTLRDLATMKGQKKVTMLTAYDVVTAQCLDQAGVDILLVGDSVGNVVYGMDTTLPVTMDMMLAHSAAVVRGSKQSMVITDLPFMSYQAGIDAAVINAGRCLKEAGAGAVKLEGAGPYTLQVIRRLVEIGIPVMGHVGLTPQSVHQMGGYFKHGKTEGAAKLLTEQALALQDAGCFAVVLEMVEESLTKSITEQLKILTIGIGSGKDCDGQVLVINDVVGFVPGTSPKFAKVYCDVKTMVSQAAQNFVKDVQS